MTSDTLTGLTARARAVRAAIEQEVGEARRVAEQGKAAEAAVERLEAQVGVHEQVIAVLTRLGEASQEAAQQRVEGLVTRGLQTIFSEDLSFHLVPGERAGQATMDFIIRTKSPGGPYDSSVLDTPVLEARGGGMAVVVAFMLRLVVLLFTPGARRVLFLDESFSHVSAEYRPRLAEFLREVASQAGVQIVMVSHDSEYTEHADRHHELALGPDGATEVSA
jgi:DNA repair exonuclease SbcCD ATPase subunit